MTEKRFTIKLQDDLFGVVDNYSADKVCVINGIRTEIEAEWLCKDMNTLNDENEQLKQQNADWETSFDKCKHYKEAYGTEIVKIKQTIKDMIKTERTELGRSVLKQLWEAIQ